MWSNSSGSNHGPWRALPDPYDGAWFDWDSAWVGLAERVSVLEAAISAMVESREERGVRPGLGTDQALQARSQQPPCAGASASPRDAAAGFVGGATHAEAIVGLGEREGAHLPNATCIVYDYVATVMIGEPRPESPRAEPASEDLASPQALRAMLAQVAARGHVATLPPPPVKPLPRNGIVASLGSVAKCGSRGSLVPRPRVPPVASNTQRRSLGTRVSSCVPSVEG